MGLILCVACSIVQADHHDDDDDKLDPEAVGHQREEATLEKN